MTATPCYTCGVKPRLPYSNSYCRECRNAYMRAKRPRYRELSAWERRKSITRSYSNVLQKRRKILRGPCERCTAEIAEKHHPDYLDPRTVTWLCQRCHDALHRLFPTGVNF